MISSGEDMTENYPRPIPTEGVWCAVFLQNAWSFLYERMEEWPYGSYLFAMEKSRTGQVLSKVIDLADWWSGRAIFTNCSPLITSRPGDMFPPDDDWIKSELETIRPGIVLACGAHSRRAIPGLWSGPLVISPHPTARKLHRDTFEAVRQTLHAWHPGQAPFRYEIQSTPSGPVVVNRSPDTKQQNLF